MRSLLRTIAVLQLIQCTRGFSQLCPSTASAINKARMYAISMDMRKTLCSEERASGGEGMHDDGHLESPRSFGRRAMDFGNASLDVAMDSITNLLAACLLITMVLNASGYGCKIGPDGVDIRPLEEMRRENAIRRMRATLFTEAGGTRVAPSRIHQEQNED